LTCAASTKGKEGSWKDSKKDGRRLTIGGSYASERQRKLEKGGAERQGKRQGKNASESHGGDLFGPGKGKKVMNTSMAFQLGRGKNHHRKTIIKRQRRRMKRNYPR